MILEISVDERVLKIDVSPKMVYESNGTLYEFPHSEFNEEYQPIYHTISVVVSMEQIDMECTLTQEVENQLKEKYYLEENEDQLVVARLEITEFPNEWKEEMGDSWFNWLDALDGDYAVIGERADRIVNEDIYGEAFEYGSLYYIQRLDVHPEFRGQEVGLKLIQHTFKYMLRNANGMVFLIAKPMKSKLSKKSNVFKSSSRLSNYYKKCGFKRIRNRSTKSIVMETCVEDLYLDS
ncbi:N-acetyltransferase [Paenibacillus sp. Y412MC10]|uniref:GNAT family N-acetyltransferase n=1 Tax=Geobacillus sp. (strain Y412MC10) TaxID=481743 RepID=UPI0021B25C46|nr:GNAT family N-acetyltransferase [Paenibacillus sp. Y412MC10]